MTPLPYLILESPRPVFPTGSLLDSELEYVVDNVQDAKALERTLPATVVVRVRSYEGSFTPLSTEDLPLS